VKAWLLNGSLHVNANARISFSRHVLEKLEKYLSSLGVSKNDVVDAVRKPDDVVYDVLENRYVALSYKKNLAVVYERNEEVIIVTAI